MKLKKRRLTKIFPYCSKKSHGENDVKKLNHSTKLPNFFTKNCFQGLIPCLSFSKMRYLCNLHLWSQAFAIKVDKRFRQQKNPKVYEKSKYFLAERFLGTFF